MHTIIDSFFKLLEFLVVACLAFAPAIDISRSGTRNEELINDPQLLKKMYVLRRILNPMGTMDAIDFLLDKLRSTKTNSEFFESMNT